jgi:hypothetical protein
VSFEFQNMGGQRSAGRYQQIMSFFPNSTLHFPIHRTSTLVPLWCYECNEKVEYDYQNWWEWEKKPPTFTDQIDDNDALSLSAAFAIAFGFTSRKSTAKDPNDTTIWQNGFNLLTLSVRFAFKWIFTGQVITIHSSSSLPRISPSATNMTKYFGCNTSLP